MRRTERAIFLLAGLGCAGYAAAQTQAPVLTIYSSARPGFAEPQFRGPASVDPGSVPGYGIVQEHTTLELPAGRSTLRYPGVPAAIDPATVRVRSLTDPETRVLEQRFEFDFQNTATLLQRYVGHEVVVEQIRNGGVVASEGRLVAVFDGLVLEQDDGTMQLIRAYDNIRFPQLPMDLVARPTLVWTVDTRQAGAHDTRITYETRGLTWWADYGAVVREGDEGCRLDLDSWATVVNYSGAAYPDARLRLVVGEPQRAGSSAPMAMMESRAADASGPADFARQAVSEYHLYTLERATSLPRNAVTQIRLGAPVAGVACEKAYVYDGLGGHWPRAPRPLLEPQIGPEPSRAISSYLSFQNERDAGLGVPLPAGRVRVSEVGPDEQDPIFAGEHIIGHTAEGEEVRLRLGTAFDLTGERRQTDFRVDSARQVLEEEILIELRNAKDRPVTIAAEEQLYRWANWAIVEQSSDFQRLDARTVRFPVTVPAGGTAQVRYRVRYTW